MPNLGLAAVTYFNYYYYCMFSVTTLLLYFYKLFHLPYPAGHVASELLIFALLCSVQYMRLYLCRKGNLTDCWAPVFVSLLLEIPSMLGILYFLLWQTYVLRIELIIIYVEIIFEILCFILSLLHFITLLYYKG
ncbi:hypothetical protein O3M35_000166 [Rhynocoris fuscipes]|uniref:Transmembrane protein 216 n=1 Tax=Rhynocoris fuscipes TaxID=488301 RepID=A0AAW1DR60_9HEMI